MYTSISNARTGDTIVEGRSRIEIRKIEHNACSTRGTHVNRSMCYDRGSMVHLEVGSVTTEEDEDSQALGAGDVPLYISERLLALI